MKTTKVVNLTIRPVTARVAVGLASLMVLFALTAGSLAAESAPDAKRENKLLGSWKLVSGKYNGQEIQFGETVMVKHLTAKCFMWANYDKDGKITRAAGGTVKLEGNTYEETPAYGISEDFDVIKGRPQKFTWRIEGNKWYHSGELSNGMKIEEVWERIEKL